MKDYCKEELILWRKHKYMAFLCYKFGSVSLLAESNFYEENVTNKSLNEWHAALF